jgi:hypothetical protein
MANENGDAATVPHGSDVAHESDPKGKGKAVATDDVPQDRSMDEDDDDDDDEDDEDLAEVRCGLPTLALLDKVNWLTLPSGG